MSFVVFLGNLLLALVIRRIISDILMRWHRQTLNRLGTTKQRENPTEYERIRGLICCVYHLILFPAMTPEQVRRELYALKSPNYLDAIDRWEGVYGEPAITSIQRKLQL